MGKGNRNKNQQAKETLLASKPKSAGRKKNGMPTWVGTLIVVAVLVVLIGVVAFSAMYSKGTFLHMKTVAESEHYSFNASMMSYVVYSEYQTFVSQYSSSSYGNILSYIKGTGGESLSTSKGLRSQYYSRPTEASPDTQTLTWFDYFAGSAKSSVQQVLTYCEIANYYGMGLEQSDYDSIEESLNEIVSYAKSQGYTTNEYLMSMYGKGVTLREVRKVMELTQLASKMATVKGEEFELAVVDSRIDAEYEANKSKYDIYVSYLGYTFTATFKPEEDAENKDALNDEYVAKQQQYAARVEELKAAATEEEFTNLILRWVYDDTYKTEYDKAIAEGSSEEEAATKANEKAEAESLKASTGATVRNHTKGDDTGDLDTWLYEEGRAIGDKTTIVSESNAKNEDGSFVDEATSTYSAYFMTDPVHHDNGEVVRSVGHILFKTDTFDSLTSTASLTGKVKELADKIFARDGAVTAYTMATELLDTMMADGKVTVTTEGDRTYYTIDKAAFEEYGLAYTEDSNVFYDDVATGDMVQEFEDWLFDGGRRVGDLSYPEPVKSEYGYHIMMYVGNEKKAWRHEIAETLANTDFENWYTEESAKITVNFNDKSLKSITG